MAFGSPVGGAEVLLSLQDKGFTTGLAQAEAKLKGFSGNAGASMGGFQKVAAGAFVAAAAGAVVFAAQSIKAYMESEAVLKQLQNTISHSPLLIGETTKAFEDQANALQKLTGVQDEEILSADTVLARFQLTGDQIRDLIPLVLDYSRATGVDTVTAAQNLGKALDGQGRALKVLGINFVATGDRTKDLATMMDLLKGKVGGAAEEFGKTTQGKIAIFNTQLDEIKETVGQALIPVLTHLIDVLGGLLPVIIPLLQNIVLLGGAFLAFKAVTFLPGLLLSVAVGLERIGATGAANALLGAASGMEAFAAALGVAAPLLALLGVAVWGLTHTMGEHNRIIADAEATIRKYGSASTQGAAATKELWHEVVTSGGKFAFTSDKVRGFEGNIKDLDAAHRNLATQIHAAVDALKAEEDQSHRTTDAILAQRAATDQLAGGILGLVSSARQAHDANVALAQAQHQVNEDIAKGKTGTKEYAQHLRDLKDAQFNALQGQLSFHGALTQYAQTLRGPVAKAQAQVEKDLADIAKGGKVAAAATARLEDDTNALTDAQHGLAPAQQKAINLLRDMGVKAGLTKGQVNSLIGRLLAQAGAIDGVSNAWHNVPTKWSTDYYVVQHGYIPGSPGHVAKGGVFKGYDVGANFLGPTGPFQAGEGNYYTRFGIGAEMVTNNGVTPLTPAVFQAIGQEMAKAGGAARGGGNIIINGDVYGYDDFRAKVAQAERSNNRERMSL